MSEIIDRKFKILAVNPCKLGAIYTENDGVYFKAEDKAVPAMLLEYKEKCMDLGCGVEHIESIDLMIDRVNRRQLVSSKIPDTETNCEIDRCIGGKV